MTRTLGALCLVLVSALPAAEEVGLPCDWAKGTIRRYELWREKENTRNGTTTIGRTQVPLTIEVVDRTAQGYRIAWSYGATQVIEPKDLDESQMRLLRVSDGLRFVFRTDTAGTPEELLNAAEVAETYRRVLSHRRPGAAGGQGGSPGRAAPGCPHRGAAAGRPGLTRLGQQAILASHSHLTEVATHGPQPLA